MTDYGDVLYGHAPASALQAVGTGYSCCLTLHYKTCLSDEALNRGPDSLWSLKTP
uniref:Uncharacterized protein n=1 Tax=Anguilla anguilla TaxID=7936 RepID=A0A0E9R6L7_ANGAN